MLPTDKEIHFRNMTFVSCLFSYTARQEMTLYGSGVKWERVLCASLVQNKGARELTSIKLILVAKYKLHFIMQGMEMNKLQGPFINFNFCSQKTRRK
jgi:hypothetical protein